MAFRLLINGPPAQSLAEADDRVVLVKESAYYWQVYQQLQEQGHLDGLARVSFDEGNRGYASQYDYSTEKTSQSPRPVHPTLRMVGHLPMHVLAEQWLSQILRHVADRAWMWQYGRFPVHLLMAERTWRVGGSCCPAMNIALKRQLSDPFCLEGLLPGRSMETRAVQALRHRSSRLRSQGKSTHGRASAIRPPLLPTRASRRGEEAHTIGREPLRLRRDNPMGQAAHHA